MNSNLENSNQGDKTLNDEIKFEVKKDSPVEEYKNEIAEDAKEKKQTLSKEERTSLIKSKYVDAMKKYSQSFIIMNKKTGKVVEMKAASSTHACKMIGWKINHCKLLGCIDG